MPTPASQPDEQRLPSPVPRYSVLPCGSVGSRVRTPTDAWSRSPTFICFQSGVEAGALSVRQMPPPEAPAQTVQSLPLPLLPQSGATTSAVMRLAVLFVAPEKAVTPGWVASCVGPTCSHFLPWLFGSPCFASELASALNVASAFATSPGVTLAAGY